MYVKLSKKFITKNLLPHLSQTHLGRKPKIPLWRIIKAIIYRLKSGCQWRELPIPIFCSHILFVVIPYLAGIQSIITLINGQKMAHGKRCGQNYCF